VEGCFNLKSSHREDQTKIVISGLKKASQCGTMCVTKQTRTGFNVQSGMQGYLLTWIRFKCPNFNAGCVLTPTSGCFKPIAGWLAANAQALACSPLAFLYPNST
jgi:hypothetical protein